MTSKEKDRDYRRLLAQEELILDATETIITLLEERGVSRADLAKRLGKSKGFVSQILSGERNMTLRTLADVGFALDHTFSLGASGTANADGLRAMFAAYATKTPMAVQIPAQAVRDRMRAVEENRGDVHEYALAA
jgi:transcriptional regulator with XRE-family HTH domain